MKRLLLVALAQNYYATYRELGGSWGFKEMQNDLLIVATASLKQMDIVVSDDESTMLSELSLKSYQIVNQILDLHSPKFMGYEDLKKKLLS